MKKFVYADNAATTPLSETAFEAMKPWLTEYYGNPSSLYRIGRAAKEALNEARATVGKCLNAAMPVNEANDYAPGEIIFTAGGSQADNLAIRGFMHGPGCLLYTSKQLITPPDHGDLLIVPLGVPAPQLKRAAKFQFPESCFHVGDHIFQFHKNPHFLLS